MANTTVWKDEFVAQARKVAQLGATDPEIAECLGISLSTVTRWKVQRKNFAEAMRVGQEIADDRVVRSLYQRAVGYTHEITKLVDGAFVTVIEHLPPDPTSCIFWLKNRRRDEWRDRKEVTGADGGAIESKVQLSNATDEQRARAVTALLESVSVKLLTNGGG
jgi:hypothetical protein